MYHDSVKEKATLMSLILRHPDNTKVEQMKKDIHLMEIYKARQINFHMFSAAAAGPPLFFAATTFDSSSVPKDFSIGAALTGAVFIVVGQTIAIIFMKKRFKKAKLIADTFNSH